MIIQLDSIMATNTAYIKELQKKSCKLESAVHLMNNTLTNCETVIQKVLKDNRSIEGEIRVAMKTQSKLNRDIYELLKNIEKVKQEFMDEGQQIR